MAPSMLCGWHSLGDRCEPLRSFYFCPPLHSLFFSALLSLLGWQAKAYILGDREESRCTGTHSGLGSVLGTGTSVLGLTAG